jgi:hypothetical protein
MMKETPIVPKHLYSIYIVMVVHKADSSPAKKKTKPSTKKTKIATSSLQALQKTRTASQNEFGRSKSTKSNYAGYIKRGKIFLADIVAERRANGEGVVCKEGINTDLLEKAFENPPNKYSAMALELFLVQKCFTENWGKSTGDGIHGAFADYWDHMSVQASNSNSSK